MCALGYKCGSGPVGPLIRWRCTVTTEMLPAARPVRYLGLLAGERRGSAVLDQSHTLAEAAADDGRLG